jgi:hypothetical protein
MILVAGGTATLGTRLVSLLPNAASRCECSPATGPGRPAWMPAPR